MAIDATITKLTCTPCPLSARKNMPKTIMLAQMSTPLGHKRIGARQLRVNTQPIAAPARNGHSVVMKPKTSNDSAWLDRPIAVKMMIATRSITAEMTAGRIVGAEAVVGAFVTVLAYS